MSSPLQQLAALRQPNTGRNSQKIVALGEQALEKGLLPRNSSETWSVLEQLAVAAMDCQKLDLASVCVKRLDDKFPNSPRVKPLVGMLLESRGELALARDYYRQELAEDENNIVRLPV